MATAASAAATPATVVHTVGSKVFVHDADEGWCKGEVVALQGSSLVVKTERGETRTVDNGEDAPLQNADARGVEDMTRLPYLHEPAVLDNLRARYGVDDIYTYTGSILIAVNPFAPLPHLYGGHMMAQYAAHDPTADAVAPLSPHVYAVADAAYRQMRREGRGQSILVSGESGAGKTETAKLIMKYLAFMGGYDEAARRGGHAGAQQQRRLSASADGGGGGGGGNNANPNANNPNNSSSAGGARSVEEQVLESNPLLEAFGNAKTSRNDNSSRFGKYVEINFDARGAISGASVRTYLLERSRVVSVNDPERSYHVFYQLCDGASDEDKARWRLKPAREFRVLAQSSCFEVPGDSNAAEYRRTVEAMARVGIPKHQRDAVLQTVAAVLHLGSIEFGPAPGDDDEAAAVLPGPRGEEPLAAAAALLGADPEALRRALATRTRHTPEGPIVSPQTPRAAADARDALAKVVYARLFDWIVSAVNAAIGRDPTAFASVGVLDIYGFESFATNDLEQFCINLANEKLQQHFNAHVFKQEQEQYEEECIDWSRVEFVDNQDVLDLIEGKLGVLDLLDETCRFPTATPKDLADKLHAADAIKASSRWSRPKTDPSAFTLRHYAGPVTYSTDNFLDKNKDYVVAEHQALLEGSSLEFVRALFPSAASAATEGGAGADGAAAPSTRNFAAFKFNSVGTQFKRQLAELMAQLNAMEPHYVRCIKPNAASAAGVFEGANALHQLRCGGVLEAVRISCAGFPSKNPYPAFADRFWPLVPDVYRAELAQARAAGGADEGPLGGDGTSLLGDGARRVAEAALRAAGVDVPEGAQLGRTKVFLRAGQMAVLDKKRLERLNSAATAIQRRVRGAQGRASAQRRRDAVLALQSGARGMLARRQARALREEKAAVAIQAAWRSFVLRRQYQGQVSAVVSLQSAWRGALARRAFAGARLERAALSAQTAWRARRARAEWGAQREAAAAMQRAARCRAAGAALRALRAEQREAGKLLQDNKALESRLAEAAGTLERVQGQRDAARAELKLLRSEAERARAESGERAAHLEAEVESLRAKVASLESELSAARAEAASALEAARAEAEASRKKFGGDKAESEKQLKVAQDYIQRLMAERGDLERRLHGMKEELIARLQNACAQRDEARAQAMELEARLQKSAADVAQAREEGAAAAAAAAAAASAAAVITTGAGGGQGQSQQGAAGAVGGDKPGVRGLMQSLASQAPGYARMIADATGGYLSGGQQAGAPEHVHGAGAGGGAAAGAAPVSAETELERRARELQARQQQLLLERRRQEEERLLAALQQDLGFSRGRPVAALAVFRACLQWRAFQADRTTVFDRIIQVIGAQIERHQDDNARLAYWLTNTVTLLALLQKNVKPASSSSSSLGAGLKGRAAAAGRSVLGGLFGAGSGVGGGMLGGRGSAGGAPPGAGGMMGSSPYGAAGRVAASGEASIHGGGVGGFRAVEAKYPALLFKQQLDAFVQKVFPMVRDNVKKAITPLLAHCIHTPRGGGGGGGGGGALASAGSSGGPRRSGAGGPAANANPPAHQSGATAAAAADAQSRAWADILAALDELLATLTAAHVPKPLVRCLFKQLFAFVNVQLFNQLLLRRECCSFSNGEYVKTGLGRVEQWIMEAGAESVGDSWDELRFIRQAVTFLVVGNKPRKQLDDITRDLCPVLSVQQLYRISTMYWDDKYQTETVSSEVLAQMKARMVENAALAAAGGGGGGGYGGGLGGGGASHSFLLDDDSTLPFSAAEVCAQLDDRDLYAAISPLPEALRDPAAAAGAAAGAAGGAAGGGAAGGGGGSGGFAFLEKELRFGSSG